MTDRARSGGFRTTADRAGHLRRPFMSIAIAAVVGAAAPNGGDATVVDIDGVRSVLIRVEHPRGSLVILPGGDGILNVAPDGGFTGNVTNVLVRNRAAFAARGFDVLLVENGTDLAAAVRFMAAMRKPVTVVATSAGTQRAARGIAAGARPDRLVLTSGFLTTQSGPGDSVAAILGSPSRLPPTLIIHHRQDHCRFTRPAGVMSFLAWSGGRADAVWLAGGTEGDNPCRFDAHHGFAGRDDALVSRIVRFAGR